MAETFTANYGWTKPEIGASIDTWGGYINVDLDGIDTTVKSVSNAIPAASSTTPLMNGTAAVGTGTTWARNNHVHPTDTSLLPLTGGTISGSLTVNAGFGLPNTAGIDYAYFGAGLGLIGFWWQSSVPGLHAMRNGTDLGIIAYTSDYRIKKDVASLPSTWDRVKALKPISYTHKDYTPPGAFADQGEVAPSPFIVGSDTVWWGFIAHELQETLTASAASGVKDQPDLIQSPNPWTVIATLTKALQEAMTRIEALEAAI